MNKFLPTILVQVISLVVLYFLFSKGVLDQEDYYYLLVCSIVFAVFNYIFSFLIRSSKGTKSISVLMGVSGVTMFLFVLLLFLYQPITHSKLEMVIAISLFSLYALYKLALFLPIIGSK